MQMNLTDTLRRIDVFLGASEKTFQVADVQRAVAILKPVCDDLLTKALQQAESIPIDGTDLMLKNMYDTIESSLKTPPMKRIPLHALAEACKQLVAVYNNTYKLLCQNGDETDRANYERRTYDTLSSALQRKHIELIHDAYEED